MRKPTARRARTQNRGKSSRNPRRSRQRLQHRPMDLRYPSRPDRNRATGSAPSAAVVGVGAVGAVAIEARTPIRMQPPRDRIPVLAPVRRLLSTPILHRAQEHLRVAQATRVTPPIQQTPSLSALSIRRRLRRHRRRVRRAQHLRRSKRRSLSGPQARAAIRCLGARTPHEETNERASFVRYSLLATVDALRAI